MGVSKNSATPKWIVYKGKPYEQMDDLGVFYHPYFWFNTQIQREVLKGCIKFSSFLP